MAHCMDRKRGQIWAMAMHAVRIHEKSAMLDSIAEQVIIGGNFRSAAAYITTVGVCDVSILLEPFANGCEANDNQQK